MDRSGGFEDRAANAGSSTGRWLNVGFQVFIMSSTPTITGPAQRQPNAAARRAPKYPGIRVTCNGNQLVTQYVETRITEGGVFYPITPSTEGGEIYQQSYAQGELN